MDIKKELKKLHVSDRRSHKGENGRLLIIGGSTLFHSASLWSLKVASRIVDLVHYSSVKENNRIVHELKKEFRDGIVIPRREIEGYIDEDDCILIGPGMMRSNRLEIKDQKSKINNMNDIENIKDEGVQTYFLTKYLLQKYPHKRWVIDAGALQMLEPEWIPKNAILTPHSREFEYLIKKRNNSSISLNVNNQKLIKDSAKQAVQAFAKDYNCIVLLKGKEDIIASKNRMEIVKGGNAGMTKGGTGDVLAGLIAAFYTKNNAFLAALSGSYINKKAGEDLSRIMGLWFNTSDLADQIPITMKRLINIR